MPVEQAEIRGELPGARAGGRLGEMLLARFRPYEHQADRRQTFGGAGDRMDDGCGVVPVAKRSAPEQQQIVGSDARDTLPRPGPCAHRELLGATEWNDGQ